MSGTSTRVATSTTTTRTTVTRASPTGHVSSQGASAQPWPGTIQIHREPNATRRSDIGANNPGGDGGRTPKRPTRLARRPSIKPECVVGCEALYWSARKCWKGVGRKYSAQKYSLNIIAETLKLHKALVGSISGSVDHTGEKTIITYPQLTGIQTRKRNFNRNCH